MILAVKALLLATAMWAVPTLALATETVSADRIAIQVLDRLDAGDFVAAEASFGATAATTASKRDAATARHPPARSFDRTAPGNRSR